MTFWNGSLSGRRPALTPKVSRYLAIAVSLTAKVLRLLPDNLQGSPYNFADLVEVYGFPGFDTNSDVFSFDLLRRRGNDESVPQ